MEDEEVELAAAGEDVIDATVQGDGFETLDQSFTQNSIGQIG